ncbi:MAG: hypothetical protein WBM46_17375 [Polyangiales bacterium]
MEEQPNAEDAEHLSALSIGHFLLAGVSLLSGVPILIYGLAGAKLMDELGSDLSMALGNVPGQPGASPYGTDPDALLQGLGTLVSVAIVTGVVVALVSAVHLLLVGVKIRQRRWWTFCYLTGWGECLMFPFGTILGIFTIIVLSRPTVKRTFGVR